MQKILRRLRGEFPLHIMLIPPIIFVFIFSYIPLYGLIIAFQRYNPALGFASPWVGMQNFERLFGQPSFIKLIWNTLFIAILKIIAGIIVPVTFSLLLNEIRNILTKRVFQTIIYIPNFLSWIIMAGVFMDILSPNGIVNSILTSLGGEAVNFLGDPNIFPFTIVVTDVWKTFGFGTVIYLAALTSIDPGLYEAAVMDGVGRWKQTIYITLPLIAPIIVLMSILSLGNILNAGFDQIFNMYSPIVYSTGDIIDTYVYRMGIENAQYSVATAVGMFKSVITGILISMSYVLADKVAGYRVF